MLHEICPLCSVFPYCVNDVETQEIGQWNPCQSSIAGEEANSVATASSLPSRIPLCTGWSFASELFAISILSRSHSFTHASPSILPVLLSLDPFVHNRHISCLPNLHPYLSIRIPTSILCRNGSSNCFGTSSHVLLLMKHSQPKAKWWSEVPKARSHSSCGAGWWNGSPAGADDLPVLHYLRIPAP